MNERSCLDCPLPDGLHEEIASALEAGSLADGERSEIARIAATRPAPGSRRRFPLRPLVPLAAAAVVAAALLLPRGASDPAPPEPRSAADVESEREANYRAWSESWDRLSAYDREVYVAFVEGRFAAWDRDPAALDARTRETFPRAGHRLFFRIADAGDRDGRPGVPAWEGTCDPMYEIPGWYLGKDPGRGAVALRRYLLPDGSGGYREWAGHPGDGPPPLRLGGRNWPHAGAAVHEEAVRTGRPLLELRGDAGLVGPELFSDPEVRARLGDFLLSYFFFEHPIRMQVGEKEISFDPEPKLVVLGTRPPVSGVPATYAAGGDGGELYDRARLLLHPGVAAEGIVSFLDRFRTPAEGRWVRVPGGPFLFGEPERLETRSVPAFEIGVTEVTNRQWAEYCAARGVEFDVPAEKLDHPVRGISFTEARRFCRWAGGRLPTEVEWQKAARGAEGARSWPWGDEPPPVAPANLRETGLGGPAPVGIFPRDVSPFGVRDMGGNVSEFVGYPGRTGGAYVGGSYLDDRADARIWLRTEVDVGDAHRWPYVGFRVVRPAE